MIEQVYWAQIKFSAIIIQQIKIAFKFKKNLNNNNSNKILIKF